MRRIDDSEANAYLGQIGMKIGDWGQVCDATDRLYDKSEWFTHRAPSGAHELHNFAAHVARWVPAGTWKIFRIDDSTSFRAGEAFLIWRLLFGQSSETEWLHHRAFCAELNGGPDDEAEEMLFCNLIYFFLLFEAHGQLVSSGCADERILSIQDGFVDFKSRNKADLLAAKAMMETFESAPLRLPWME